MKKRSMKLSLRLLLVLMSITMIAQSVLAVNTTDAGEYDDWGKYMGAGIALGLAAIGAGYSQGNIGSAAVGMLAEDGSKFGPALIFTALPESIVILGALPLFL